MTNYKFGMIIQKSKKKLTKLKMFKLILKIGMEKTFQISNLSIQKNLIIQKKPIKIYLKYYFQTQKIKILLKMNKSIGSNKIQENTFKLNEILNIHHNLFKYYL